MQIRLVECVEWAAPNLPGELLRYANQFSKGGVDLDALWAYTSHEHEHKMAAVAKSAAPLKRALRRMGVPFHSGRCFYLVEKDRPGALVEVFRKLASANLNIECADAMAAAGSFATVLWVAPAHMRRAQRVLKSR